MTTADSQSPSAFPRKRRHGVEVSSWTRRSDQAQFLNALLIKALAEEIEGLDDDAPAPFTVGQLREWLKRDGVQGSVTGAQVTDHLLGVTYRVTLDEAASTPTLKTVEVLATKQPIDDRIFRIPTRSLVQEVLTLEEYSAARGVDIVIGARGGGQPSPERLIELVKQGLKRKEIGEMYGRSEARVDQWLQKARAARPDLRWPEKQPNQHSQSKRDGR